MQEIQETQVKSMDREDPLKKQMTTHSSILAWEIPWTEKPGGLQSMGSQRVGHNWGTEHTFTPINNKIKIISPFILKNKFTCLIVKSYHPWVPLFLLIYHFPLYILDCNATIKNRSELWYFQNDMLSFRDRSTFICNFPELPHFTACIILATFYICPRL